VEDRDLLIIEHLVRNNDTFTGSQTGCNVGQRSTDNEKFLLADNGDVDIRHELAGHHGHGAAGTAAADDDELVSFLHGASPVVEVAG
jgi:hypothetical protein